MDRPVFWQAMPHHSFKGTRISHRRARKYLWRCATRYEFHPNAKWAGPTGASCSKQTIGLLGRRHVAIDSTTYIGKESNLQNALAVFHETVACSWLSMARMD